MMNQDKKKIEFYIKLNYPAYFNTQDFTNVFKYTDLTGLLDFIMFFSPDLMVNLYQNNIIPDSYYEGKREKLFSYYLDFYKEDPLSSSAARNIKDLEGKYSKAYEMCIFAFLNELENIGVYDHTKAHIAYYNEIYQGIRVNYNKVDGLIHFSKKFNLIKAGSFNDWFKADYKTLYIYDYVSLYIQEQYGQNKSIFVMYVFNKVVDQLLKDSRSKAEVIGES